MTPRITASPACRTQPFRNAFIQSTTSYSDRAHVILSMIASSRAQLPHPLCRPSHGERACTFHIKAANLHEPHLRMAYEARQPVTEKILQKMFTRTQSFLQFRSNARPVLFCPLHAVQFYSVLFCCCCSVLVCSVLFSCCAFLSYSVLFYSVLLCFVLFCSVLFHVILFRSFLASSIPFLSV